MVEKQDDIGIREKVHIVLRGPDGKVKDERIIKPEAENGTDKQTGD